MKKRIKLLVCLWVLFMVPALIIGAEHEQKTQKQQTSVQWTRLYSEIIDTEISNEAGELQGTIDDVIFSPDGEVSHLVVRTSEMPKQDQQMQEDQAQHMEQDQQQAQDQQQQDEMKQRMAARRAGYIVPVDKIDINMQGTGEQARINAVLKVSQSDLQKYESLQNGKLPDTIAQAEDEKKPHLGSELMNYSFVTQAGEDLGRVEDVMLDVKNKQVAFLVLSPGEVLGAAQALYAVPMGLIAGVDAQNQEITVDLGGSPQQEQQQMQDEQQQEQTDMEQEQGQQSDVEEGY
jgi:sporulation protein YlmC with PRC-barrel domain